MYVRLGGGGAAGAGVTAGESRPLLTIAARRPVWPSGD